MAANVEAMRHMAKSVLSCVFLSLCSLGSHIGPFEDKNNEEGGVSSAVQWASVVTLLSAVYYLQFQIWNRLWHQKKNRRSPLRNQYRQTHTTSSIDASSSSSNVEDVELDSLPPSGDSEEGWVEGVNVVSNNVYYPELTMSSVWTYVYGWGVLLFVCIYCLAGVNVPSSCWWVLGMMALSFDELISKGIGKWWVFFVGFSLCWSVFAVWSGSMMDDKGDFLADAMFTDSGSMSLFSFILGVAFPVSSPFIFFTIRSTVRNINRDVSKLCEFALPFMTVLAVCYLVANSGVCVAVNINQDKTSGDISGLHNVVHISSGLKPARDLHMGVGSDGATDLDGLSAQSKVHNSTTMVVETMAKFASSYKTNLSGHNTHLSLHSGVIGYTLLFISPLAAFWLIRVLVVAILTGHSTEFITAFILVTSARFGMTHSLGAWSFMALSGAGSAFVQLLFIRRN
jgi:hypothetical protein